MSNIFNPLSIIYTLVILVSFQLNAYSQTKSIEAPGKFTFTISQNFGQVSRTYLDNDGDSIADLYNELYYYNEKGQLITKFLDNDVDGDPQAVHYFSYDSNGFNNSWRIYLLHDTSLARLDTFSYSPKGTYTMYRSDYNADGIYDIFFEQDVNSMDLVTEKRNDLDGDGVFDKYLYYTYDNLGNMTSSTRDGDADSVLEYVRTWTYNSNGCLTKDERNDSINTSHESFYAYGVDSNCNTLWVKHEGNGDTIIDNVQYYSYTNGLLSKIEYDNGYNSVINYVYYFYYDSLGNIVSEERDNNNDGTIDLVETWEFNADNLQVYYGYDNDNDGQDEYVVKNKYDGHYLVEDWIDTDGDGNYNVLKKWHYRSDSVLISYWYDNDGDQVPDVNFWYSFDNNGNYGRSYDDIDGNGTADRITFYEYENLETCDLADKGPSHRLKVHIPDSGDWIVKTCGTDFSHQVFVSDTTYCDTSVLNISKTCAAKGLEGRIFLDSGFYYVTVVGMDSSQLGDYTIEFIKAGTLSINEHALINTLKLYPNPTNGLVTINSDLNFKEINVFDEFGRLILSQNQQAVDLSNYPAGLYFVYVLDENKRVHTSKILKL